MRVYGERVWGLRLRVEGIPTQTIKKSSQFHEFERYEPGSGLRVSGPGIGCLESGFGV